MVNSMVERATSDKLIGPDWAMNVEICETLNHDPGQIKDVVKGIKKRMKSRNPKVQILALTLLETLIKNCGEIIHMHVAERDILHEMVKIVKKKNPDVRVKEKVLAMIDAWREAFGGARSRHTQYFAAYQELLHAGVRFPQRSAAAPALTPQTQSLSSDPSCVHSYSNEEEAVRLSAEDEYPTLSSTEIENARGIMDVLSEMLNALNPENKEELKQDVIVDLVEQCRTYKQRVVHLVNSTLDESLLRQGLALNDDLQRLLAKHEAIAIGTPVDEPKAGPPGPLVDVDTPLIDTGDHGKQPNVSASSAAEGDTLNQLLLPAPLMSNGAAPLGNADGNIDLLSGGSFSSPTAETALVPLDESHQTNSIPVSQQNALVPFDIFPDDNNALNSASNQNVDKAGPHNPLSTQSQLQQHIQSSQAELPTNGMTPDIGSTQYEKRMYSEPVWNGQILQQQQLSDPPVDGAESSGAFPPPPWEVQPSDGSPVESEQYPQSMQFMQPVQAGVQLQRPQSLMNNQMVGMYMQPNAVGKQSAVSSLNQFSGLHPQQMQGMQYVGILPQQYQLGQMGSMYPQPMYGGQVGAYSYSQNQGAQNLNQQMSGVSMRDDSCLKSSSTSSYMPPTKPPKAEDKLFGDLVDIARFKPPKPTPGRAESM